MNDDVTGSMTSTREHGLEEDGNPLDRRLEIERLEREHDGALARITALDAMIAERSALLAARDELISRFQNQAAVRDELILIRDRQIDARDQRISQLRAQVEATKRLYVNSTSWKITAPLRAAIRLARTGRLRAPRVEIAEETPDDPQKTAMRGRLMARLDSFLGGSEMLRLPRAEMPGVSILLVLHHLAEYTICCLDSILQTLDGGDPGIEIVIVDNASTDCTAELLERIEGATVIRSPVGLPFLKAANLGAGSARGKNLLLLDNAVRLLPGALASALKTLDSAEGIGAVGGRVILPDGRLREAGAILWRDGACAGYGEGGDPADPDFMFQRDVDFCSGAFLLTKTQVFRELGGFDERFAPGCYGAADYCVRVWMSGRRVVYDPDAAIIHEEFGGAALATPAADRDVFVGRHGGWLALQFAAAPANLLAARAARSPQPRILVLEDRVPKPELGAGYPRSNRLLHELLEAGAEITLFPMYRHQESWESVRRVLDKRIEVRILADGSGIGAYLSARRGLYDAILVCRPHNMNVLLEAMGAVRDLIGTAKLIYDAEAFFVTRTLQRMKADGQPATELERRRLSAKEIMLAWCADEVISVSAAEKEILETYGAKRIHVLGHALQDAPLPSGFEARDQIVFLGAMPEDDAPNADAVRWFASEILPEIRRSLGQNLRLTAIGRAEAPTIRALDGDRVDLLGMVDDLAPALARARLLVVPTRVAAGLPHKVHQAAMLGIPMVVTELIFGQLGWERDTDVMVADDPNGFAAACVRLYRDRALWEQVRGNARARAVEDCDPEAFRATVDEIVRGIPVRRVLSEAPACGASPAGNSVQAGGSALQ